MSNKDYEEERIIYEEETVTDEICTGSVIATGNEEEQREKVFKLMEQSGIKINPKYDISIEFYPEDTDDRNQVKFVVNVNVKVLVPYVISSEKIFDGTYILDGQSISPQEQRERIFEMMRKEGVEIGNKEDLDIRYEGAEAFDDVMQTNFSVYRINKRPLEEKFIADKENDNIVEIDGKLYEEEKELVGVGFQKNGEDIYAAIQRNHGLDIRNDSSYEIVYKEENEKGREYELIRIRKHEVNDLEYVNREVKEEALEKIDVLQKKLNKMEKKEEDQIVIDKLSDEVMSIENTMQDEVGMTDKVRKELELITANIKDLQKELKASMKDYEEAFLGMQELIKEQDIKLEELGLLDDDELLAINEEFTEKRIVESEKAVAIRKKIDAQRRQLTAITRRKNKIEKDILNSEALGITVADYQEITSTLKKKKIFDAVVSRKGLEEVLEKPAKERTKEEKQALKEIREEITREIAHLQKEDENVSVLEAIEALYQIDPVMIMAKKSKKTVVPEKQLEKIKENATQLPMRVVNNEQTVNNYVPGKAPQDMVDAIEEKETVNNEITERISIFEDLDSNKKYVKKATCKRFNIQTSGNGVKIDGALCFEIDKDDYDFISNNASNDYSPYNVVEKEVHLGKETVNNEMTEKISIFEDLDSNKKYVKKTTCKRFNIQTSGNGVRIDGALCYEIDKDDYDFISNNASNDYSPYNVVEKEVHLGKDVSKKAVTLYRDKNDNNQVYATDKLLNHLGITPDGDSRPIKTNSSCYKIDNETEKLINENPNLDVRYEDVSLSKKKKPKKEEKRIIDEPPKEEEKVTDESPKEEEKITDESEPKIVPPFEEPIKRTITIYRDLNDDNQLYVSVGILNKLGITGLGKARKIGSVNCKKINEEIDKAINDYASASKNPIYNIKYVDVHLDKIKNEQEEKVARPHVEKIIDNLTTDLDIRAKDSKRFESSNIKVSKMMKNELHSGNYLYNIVHFAPTLAKGAFALLRKLSGKLMLSARGKQVMKELNERIHDLSLEELEVLFEEYRGSVLKQDMNNQINVPILNKLRWYGMEKVQALNDAIRDDYSNLFTLLGEIKSLEQALATNLSTEELKNVMAERKNLLADAALFVRDIEAKRVEANNLLSGGIHGLEEDFKAVQSKLSYVGMRFAKKNDFDNELQHQLGEYGQGLRDAMANNDDEKIVSNFMGLEGCYYANTKVSRSPYGMRSVGSKYYSPLAEQFDYRDDPFIRDVFSTVALTSAAVSAVNAIRVHQVESAELLKDQQNEAMNVNQANDAFKDIVDNTAKEIESRRDVFQEGMKAQAHQDVLNSTGIIERAELDMTNWSFNDVYHAADNQGHGFWNSFSDDVTNQINDITTRYATNSITSGQALQEIASVADGAQQTLASVTGECIDILKDYAATHPQFDLSAIQTSMEYILNHPDAITNMNKAAMDVTDFASGLQGLDISHATVLSSLPSDMLSTIVCAASAAGLALNVSRTMEDKYIKKNGYGNEITDMMEEYMYGNSDEFDDSKENVR